MMSAAPADGHAAVHPAVAEAIAWLERSRDSKSPSLTQIHAKTLLTYIDRSEAALAAVCADVTYLRGNLADVAYGLRSQPETTREAIAVLIDRVVAESRLREQEGTA